MAKYFLGAFQAAFFTGKWHRRADFPITAMAKCVVFKKCPSNMSYIYIISHPEKKLEPPKFKVKKLQLTAQCWSKETTRCDWHSISHL